MQADNDILVKMKNVFSQTGLLSNWSYPGRLFLSSTLLSSCLQPFASVSLVPALFYPPLFQILSEALVLLSVQYPMIWPSQFNPSSLNLIRFPSSLDCPILRTQHLHIRRRNHRGQLLLQRRHRGLRFFCVSALPWSSNRQWLWSRICFDSRYAVANFSHRVSFVILFRILGGDPTIDQLEDFQEDGDCRERMMLMPYGRWCRRNSGWRA